MASTSTSARSSQSSTRSSRVRIEFTFQVAIRRSGDRKRGEAGCSGSPPSIMPSGMATTLRGWRDVVRAVVQDEAQRAGQVGGRVIVVVNPEVATGGAARCAPGQQ